MRRNVYIVTKDEATTCFSNMTKLTRNLPEITYSKLYRALKISNTTIIEGYTITKTILR